MLPFWIALSRLEKFYLVSGIIGFFVDSVTIFSWISGIWQPAQTGSQANTSSSHVVQVVLFAIVLIVLFYSWAAIAWVLSRRYLVHRGEKSDSENRNAIIGIVIGIGILIFPMCTCWSCTSTLNANESNVQENVSEAILRATQIAQSALTPTPITGAGTPTPTPIRLRTPSEIYKSKEQDSYFGSVMASLFGCFVLGGGVVILLFSLMPVFYSEMPMINWSKVASWFDS